MTLNREWHLAYRMPPKATREQRIKWHVAHAAACGCRAVPESVRVDVEKRLNFGAIGTARQFIGAQAS